MPSDGPNVDFLLLFVLPVLAVIPLTFLLCHIQTRRKRRASYGTALSSISIVSMLWLVIASRGDCFTAEFWLSRDKHHPTALWLQLTALVAVLSALPSFLIVARHHFRDWNLTPPPSTPVTTPAPGQHQPSARRQLLHLLSFLLMVLPSIWFSSMGYLYLLEHRLKLDMEAKPEGLLDNLFGLLMILPMIPTILLGILITGIPHMFIMSRLLSWPDLQFYTNKNQKGPHIPLLSDWLNRLWLQMIEPKRPKTPSAKNL